MAMKRALAGSLKQSRRFAFWRKAYRSAYYLVDPAASYFVKYPNRQIISQMIIGCPINSPRTGTHAHVMSW